MHILWKNIRAAVTEIVAVVEEPNRCFIKSISEKKEHENVDVYEEKAT